MKGVILLAILAVFLILPESAESSWFKDRFRKLKEKVKDKWRKVKTGLARKLLNGRRDIDVLDLNQDGLFDQSELENAIGERHTRDLMDLMEMDDSMSLEEFERNARDLDELEQEDE